MKVVLTGTDHSTDQEEEIEVGIEKLLADGDDWTFTIGQKPLVNFTISDLTSVMDFIRRMNRR